jgi:hypothetical protein
MASSPQEPSGSERPQSADAAEATWAPARPLTQTGSLLKKLSRLSALVFAIAYVFLAIGYYQKQPRLARNFADELNGKIAAVPESELAWPRYRQVLLKVNGQLQPDTLASKSPHYDRAARVFAEFTLAQNPELLPAIRETAVMPQLGFRLSDMPDPADLAWIQRISPSEVPQTLRGASENPALLTILLPCLPKLRCFAQLLRLDAEQAAAAADGARTSADLLACIGIASQLDKTQLNVMRMASLKLLHEAIQTLGLVLSQYPSLLGDDQLSSLVIRLKAYGGEAGIRPNVADERMLFEDIVQRTYSDDGNGDGTAIVDLLYETIAPGEKASWLICATAPLTTHEYASRRELMSKYNAIMEQVQKACDKPLWKCVDLPGAAALRLSKAEKKSCVLIPLFVPSVSNLYLAAERAAQERDAALVEVALARFHSKRRRWPNDLDELVPNFLDEVPVDRFAGAPIKYRFRDGQPVLYSVGADRNDDDGRAPAGDEDDAAATWVPARKASHAPDGDWILWPRATPTSFKTPARVGVPAAAP